MEVDVIEGFWLEFVWPFLSRVLFLVLAVVVDIRFLLFSKMVILISQGSFDLAIDGNLSGWM